jgi:excisionase family DNA binding protein
MSSTPAHSVPLLVTYAEAARLLGKVSTRHVERLVSARKLRAVGRGKARRVVYQSILAYIDREAGNG